MTIATSLAGGLLGVVAALPAARLTEETMQHRAAHPYHLRLTLMIATVTFTVATTARHGLAITTALLLVLLPAAAAAAVDAYEQRLPDALTAATAVAVSTGIAGLLALGNDAGIRGAGALATSALVCLSAKAVFTDAIGWGDVKFAPSLAALLAAHGWPTLYTGLLAWSGLVLLTAVHAVVRRRSKIVAYGPALVGGTAGAIALGG